MEKVYTVYQHGEKVRQTYEEICQNLGFIAGVHFVQVTTRGTISFTLGKPNEIRALLSAVEREGYKPAKSLLERVRTL